MCQARRDTNGDGVVRVDVGPQGELRGDQLDGFFLEGPGDGFRIDAFGGSDPTGRFVALVRDGQLVLYDSTTHSEVTLGPDADTRDDLGSFVHPRAVAFDPTGRRLLYLRRSGPFDRIVVRYLTLPNEVSVDPGDGELWRADFDPSGDWVIARVITTDTNHDGRLDWTVKEAPAPWMRCQGPLPRYAVWERPGDESEARVAKATGGDAIVAPGLVMPFGDTLLERDPDGTLARVEPDGKRSVLAVKTCEARLLHVDGGRGTALITCLDKKKRHGVSFVDRTGVRPLPITLTVAVGDHFVEGSPRLIALQPGSSAVLVDMDHGTIDGLDDGDRILATRGARALVLRGRHLVLHESGGLERAITGDLVPLGHTLWSNDTFFVPPLVVNLDEGVLLGTSQARAIAVSRDGALLVPEKAADARRLASGPFRWVASEAVPPR